ncbi:flagellar hook-length control protein FliK [Sediminicoccus sp. KRV36]|uniref:flagellar hook-length control protein FliK n=1 Tax=Sediminicoccus sp. KRV36 TaxID=3133721 RepID=UPI00200F3C58|nr:flagellar hook-length control protein FliK [Sediminicoccus rosea]UPY36842.1 flagellar hook-length control protein FliK [Sediminicoccus rosea]
MAAATLHEVVASGAGLTKAEFPSAHTEAPLASPAEFQSPLPALLSANSPLQATDPAPQVEAEITAAVTSPLEVGIAATSDQAVERMEPHDVLPDERQKEALGEAPAEDPAEWLGEAPEQAGPAPILANSEIPPTLSLNAPAEQPRGLPTSAPPPQAEIGRQYAPTQLLPLPAGPVGTQSVVAPSVVEAPDQVPPLPAVAADRSANPAPQAGGKMEPVEPVSAASPPSPRASDAAGRRSGGQGAGQDASIPHAAAEEPAADTQSPRATSQDPAPPLSEPKPSDARPNMPPTPPITASATLAWGFEALMPHQARPAEAAAPASPPAPMPVRQIAPIAIALAFTPGNANGFQLNLDPVELGRVEIRVQREGDSHSVRVMAERPETLALLLRDRQELDRSLNDAGLRVDSKGIDFSLSPQFGQPDQRQQGEARPGQASRAASRASAQPEAEPPPTRALRGLLDLNI